MQELANFIGEDGIDQLTSIMEGDLSGEYDNIIYISPLASNDDTPRNVKLLRSILGEKSADLIQKVAKIQGKSLDDIVRLRKLPDNLNRIDVLDDAVGTPHFLQIFDDQGGDITSIIGLELDAVGQLEVDTVFAGSAMTALKEGEKCYSPSAMGKSVETPFENFYHIMSDRERRLKRIEVLQWIRKLVSRLNAVFGFDDYRQLEAFVAAWLMRNATCRLSGIPGTGKTTVINCAATLLGNSYGFHINKTYLATDSTMSYYPKDYDGNHRYTDEKQIFASNTSVSNAHVADVVPSGQAYNVMYNDQRNESTYRNWDSWRFRDWKAPNPVLSNVQVLTPTISTSYGPWNVPTNVWDFPLLMTTMLSRRPSVQSSSIRSSSIVGRQRFPMISIWTCGPRWTMLVSDVPIDPTGNPILMLSSRRRRLVRPAWSSSRSRFTTVRP